MNRQQNINLNHVSAKMYGNMKYREFYFFRIYKSTIVYFDISKKTTTKCYPTTGSVYSTRRSCKKSKTIASYR